jgi:hypothetical protein
MSGEWFTATDEMPETPCISQSVEISDFRQRYLVQVFRMTL